MEIFDVYNVQRELLGYTKIRGSILEENEYNMGTEIWIFNNKKLLMSQRSLNKSHPGKWEVPGGCSQSGESSSNTLKRELKEELNIEITDSEFNLIDTVIYKKQFVDIYISNKPINIKNIKLQEEEIKDAKFVTKKEFIEMINNNEIVSSVYERYKKIEDKIKDW